MSFTCTSRCKIGSMLTALVIVCIAGGGWIGFALGRKHERGRNQAVAWNQEVMSALQRKLKPSAEQKQRFQAAVDKAVAAMQIARNDAVKETDVIVEKLITDVRMELREDQRAEFDKLVKNRGKTTLDLLKVEKQKGK
jgi:predicted dinucleotide-binding enzyme